jgi:GNAT superfamily N-acetyltransferase
MTNSFASTSFHPSFRRLAAGEERGRMLQAHFLRLEGEDRWLRFGGYASDASVQAYSAGLEHHAGGAIVLGGFVAGELHAVGQLKPIGKAWPCAAERALSVKKPFQGRGLGTELCRRLILRARNRCIARVRMLCLRDNQMVQRIARKLGGTLRFHLGEVEAELQPAWPDPMSTFEEWLDEMMSAAAQVNVGSRAFRSGLRPSNVRLEAGRE